MKKVLISGGSGLVGSALTKLLIEKGHGVAHLSTRKDYKREDVEVYHWNPAEGKLDENAFNNVDVVVHLAGAGIADKRWSSARKQLILDSRVESAKLLTDFLKTKSHKVQCFIGASAIGYYGDREELLTEESALGEGFLAEVCQAWEQSYEAVPNAIQQTVLRLGIVLAANGGAFPEMTKTLPFFIGILGSGKQMYSWIHLDDATRLFLFAIEDKLAPGIYNAIAPNPKSQVDMATIIADIKGVFTVPTPSLALHIALGEMSEVVLNSQHCSAQKITDAGFKFKFKELNKALKDLVKS